MKVLLFLISLFWTAILLCSAAESSGLAARVFTRPDAFVDPTAPVFLWGFGIIWLLLAGFVLFWAMCTANRRV